MILDGTTKRLQVFLAGSGALPFVASWQAVAATMQRVAGQGTNTGQTSGTTPVDLAPAPDAGRIRLVKEFFVRNSSGSAKVVTVRFDDDGAARDLASFALDAGDVLQYSDAEGFSVRDSTGAVKGAGTSGGGGGSEPGPDYDAQTMALLALMEF